MHFWFSRHPRAEQRTQSSKVIAIHGDREAVRRQAVTTALQGPLEFIR
jgi:nicotinamide mononucleotide (NMN) deamidase PncC